MSSSVLTCTDTGALVGFMEPDGVGFSAAWGNLWGNARRRIPVPAMPVRAELEFRPSQMPEFVARELLDELEDLGYDAGMADAPEQRAAPELTEIVVWLGEHVAEDAITAIVGLVAGWYGRKVQDGRRKPPEVRVLFRGDGSELKRVKIKRPKD